MYNLCNSSGEQAHFVLLMLPISPCLKSNGVANEAHILLEIGVGFLHSGVTQIVSILRVCKSYAKCVVRLPTSINLRQMVGLNIDFLTE
jgi:hypothetical protein